MAAAACRRAEGRAGIVVGSFLNRALDTAALLVLAGSSCLFVPTALFRRYAGVLRGIAIAMGCGLILAAIVGVLRPSWPSVRLQRLFDRHREALALLRQPLLMLLPLALSCGIQLGFLWLNDRMAEPLGLHLSIAAWLFAWPLAKLFSMIPVSFGGIGTREVALTALLAPFGAPAGRVVATAVAWDAVVIAGGLCGGVLAWALGIYQRRGVTVPA
jgi:uncharacterized membrane protein YbhN (UPF0104 family)